ncbi:uncharacterized protein KGF55_001655 [Candida pseudojiufengensis]|uniref:uncharacterized protein n=1 Tax=Candida pseudojiufengensis TaxID=497109 RepID=UPI0022244326|nr:uncharacterized protein KGF55_001655 [Candida pseudojiufengensis]KAI5964586.1 hypothetical protein KGF55_001655 [Candida pseudojiufengensis]
MARDKKGHNSKPRSIQKSNKIQKSSSNSRSNKPQRSKSKSNKIKLDKLNSNIDEFNEITNILHNSSDNNSSLNKENLKSLKNIKEDYDKAEEDKIKNKKANDEMNKQLDILKEVGL